MSSFSAIGWFSSAKKHTYPLKLLYKQMKRGKEREYHTLNLFLRFLLVLLVINYCNNNIFIIRHKVDHTLHRICHWHLRRDNIWIWRAGSSGRRYFLQIIHNVTHTPPRRLSLTRHRQNPHHPIPVILISVKIRQKQRRMLVQRRIICQCICRQIHTIHRIEQMARCHGNIVQFLFRIGIDHVHNMFDFWIDRVDRHNDLFIIANGIALAFVSGMLDGPVG
mmetsp:Transcript_33797/g.57394  ORF Transcript_33797/g.57394 Transcript_33797/m.57394 type:complete len:221 (-) Transcript_33797:584-1246(-)